jgi:hypothetical protein
VSLLENIKLNEQEQKEFTARLEEWQKTEKEKMKADFEKQLKEANDKIVTLEKGSKSRITEDGDLDFDEKETEIMKKKLATWREEIATEVENQLGDKFFEAFTQGEEKLKKSYTDKFISTVKDIYEQIETATREKLQESSEFKAFAELKKLIAPFIVEGQYSDTVVEDVKKLKGIISEQAQKLEDVKIKTKLDQLTEGMPKAIKEDFIASLGEFKTEDELIEKFQRNIKLIKNVKEQIFHEMEDTSKKNDVEKSKVEVEPKAKPSDAEEKAKKAISESEELKKEASKILEKVEKKEEKKEVKKTAEEDLEQLKEDVDYEILSQDFKRKEEKPKNLERMQYLAGLK